MNKMKKQDRPYIAPENSVTVPYWGDPMLIIPISDERYDQLHKMILTKGKGEYEDVGGPESGPDLRYYGHYYLEFQAFHNEPAIIYDRPTCPKRQLPSCRVLCKASQVVAVV